MEEYFEGTRVIQHDDGSHTYINYSHEPPYVPLTWKENLAIYGGVLGTMGLIVGLPLWLDWRAEHAEERAKKKAAKKLAKENARNLKSV